MGVKKAHSSLCCNVNCGMYKDIRSWRKFVKTCRANGTTAAAMLRDFIYSVLEYKGDWLCKK